MAQDRNGNTVVVGDKIRLSLSMSVEGQRNGVIARIDGSDVYVDMMINGEAITGIHRYGCEFVKW